LWFEPTLNQTFAAMAEHYDTTILPTRSRKPRDKGKVEGAVLIVERWILARLRHRRFFSLTDLNAAIGGLLEDLYNRPMRHVGKSRRQLFEKIERAALAPLPIEPFEYAEWKTAKVHPDYHDVDKTFYSVPHRLMQPSHIRRSLGKFLQVDECTNYFTNTAYRRTQHSSSLARGRFRDNDLHENVSGDYSVRTSSPRKNLEVEPCPLSS
jgi:hypothetical protein